jgi:YidC/Oxa1 family membrane protein insertase
MQSQTRNYILFFLSFFLILGGYSLVRNRLWPPTPKPSVETISGFEHAARLVAAAAQPGPGDAAQFAVEAAVTRASALDYALADRAARAKQAKEKEAVAAKPAEPPKPASPPPAPVTLGGDEYYLSVLLTPRGAGVRRLTLTRFPQVDHWGLADKGPDGKVKSLELIPESDTPAFALYHYARADAEEERPLDTLGRRDWTVTEQPKPGDAEQRVSFATELPEFGVRLVKTFTLKPREYHLGLSVRVERLPGTKATAPFRYQLAGGHGLPIEGEWYTTTFRNALVAWVDDHEKTWRVLEDSNTVSRTAGSERFRRDDKRFQYAAVAIQYFTSAIVVDDQQPNRNFLEFVRATDEGAVDPKKPFLDDITVRAIAEPLDPKPGEAVEHKYLLYHGPVKVRLLSQLTGPDMAVAPELVDRYENTLRLNSLTDYGKFSNTWGEFWTNLIIFFTNLVHAIIGVLRPIVRYEGLCIILVTVLVRGLMFPVSRKQAATMQRTQEQMAKLQPEIKKIKERHKNDILAQQQAMSELYRRHGVNPAAGLGGCLMLLVQMPVFLGLYYALQESFFFRLEPFLWVRNLTAPDMLIWWTQNIPMISDPASQGGFLYLGPYFNLLPVLAVALMLLQQKLTMPPAADEQTAAQQKMMFYMMPLFGLMFYKMPAGLCIYFICTTLWGLTERKLLPKKKPATETAAAGKAGTGNGRPGPRGRGKAQPEAPPGKLREWWERLLKEASKK